MTADFENTSGATHRPEPEDHSDRNRMVIGLLLISAFVVILNETIMAVALPRLMKDLQITASLAQWLSTAFMLTMAVVIPVTGYLLQRLNTRPVFMLAMSLFSVGTLVSALAPGFSVLVIGRIVQASGTAIMMPLLMTTVMHLLPPETRGKTMGNISIVISVAPAIGPTISGLILSVLDWRWMFLLVLPIALGALALGAWKIANVTQPSSASIDIPSVPLAALGFGSFVFGLSGLGEAATHPPAISPWVPLVAGAVIILVFVLRQLRLQKQERALLDMRTLAIPAFTIPAVMMAILMMSMFGVFILLPIFLQNVVELTTLQTGLLLLPGGLIMGLCAQGGEPLRHAWATQTRGAWRDPLQHGDVAADILIHSDTPVLLLLAAHVVLSIGLALMFTPLFTASLGSLPPRPLFARQRDDRDDAAGGGRRRDRAFRRDHDHAEQRSHAFRRRIGRGHCGRHPRCLPLRSHHLAGRNFGGLLHPKAEGGRRKAEEGDTPRAH